MRLYASTRQHTVVVDEVGNADAEEGRIQPSIETSDAFSLYDAARSVESR